MSEPAKPARQPAGQFTIHVEHVSGYEFRVRFDKEPMAALHTDEPPPLGKDAGPNPTRLLAAALANCLSASLLFCVQRAGTTLAGLSADASVTLVRNERRRLRVGEVDVVLRPRLPAGADPEKFSGCLGAFEDFCTVTQSVRQGLDVKVRVEPAADSQG